MRRALGFLTIVSVFALTVACGRISSPGLTGPSPLPSGGPTSATPVPLPPPVPAPVPQWPSLTGRWIGGARVILRNRENGATHYFSCEGRFFLTEQTGTQFQGQAGLQGGGWNSDRFCTFSGLVIGVLLAPDGSARATIERRLSAASCDFVSGDGIYTGSVTATQMRLESVDILNCNAPLVAGSGFPRADFARTVTLRFERETTQ